MSQSNCDGNSVPTLIDLASAQGAADKLYYPNVLGHLNDHIIYAETLSGEFMWHSHEREQLYICVSGEVSVELRTGRHDLKPMQALLIPAGVEHCPDCPKGAVVVIIEPKAMFDHEQSSGMYDPFDKR